MYSNYMFPEKVVYIMEITDTLMIQSTNLGLGLPAENARSDDPRLVSTC